MKEIGKLYLDENRNLLFDDGIGGYFVVLTYQRPPTKPMRLELSEMKVL
jgi:hypothetical protein